MKCKHGKDIKESCARCRDQINAKVAAGVLRAEPVRTKVEPHPKWRSE